MKTPDFLKPNERPLIAILRGVTEDSVVSVAQTLIDAGISIIEVPLNSPNALVSISRLVGCFGDSYLVGAGTVTTEVELEAVVATGAKLIVTPNFNPKVVKKAVAADCICLPGVITPTEAFAALAEGAQGLKLFPVTQMGAVNFKALMSVLPAGTHCFPVGGISEEGSTMAPYLQAGAVGFGIGSSLYEPDIDISELASRARSLVETFDHLTRLLP
ncbi:2-dehydro-3-deoxy-6-phosphogalactonate aldolase [Gilvimarinus agarilyticus]|uniref:2-dehydro-3-deoxy-6-phosphogalactonate aldolase n=1 Tax=Gilvimarinus sp. 2_MG-2023 TaxID=3062666 RepID=UPI001C0954CC|nr:2-dehydro-3-deoxy-6-phosphogalactonate aldolase [Gilvimarinus sp. 2_MG-2023]MBU2886386.1 2-dehydro-3-deoxy-6-phosphogalactonate aldolase [Gilvimarinus agarilyticus]MDO6571065.1 2-dehydro-3-deoxy-6-phosphogalactonate aldolase [Gilvimarinus sp. 2_MG-2023]